MLYERFVYSMDIAREKAHLFTVVNIPVQIHSDEHISEGSDVMLQLARRFPLWDEVLLAEPALVSAGLWVGSCGESVVFPWEHQRSRKDSDSGKSLSELKIQAFEKNCVPESLSTWPFGTWSVLLLAALGRRNSLVSCSI